MFKKGQKVTMFHIQPNRDYTALSVWSRDFEVMSWGAKQGTLSHVVDGKNAEFRVYTQQAVRPWNGEDVVLTDGLDRDARVHALKLEVVRHQIKFITEERLTRPTVYNPELMRKHLANLEILLAQLTA